LRIAIYGGTFDPVHIAHLIIADYACAELSLDKLLFVPSYSPPHKLSVAITAPSHRLNMVKIAIAQNRKFKLSDYEIMKEGTSFTVDTLRYYSEYFQVQRKHLYLIIGADNLVDFHLWKDPDEILRLAQIAVANRPANCISKVSIKDFITLGAPLLDISASMIRKRIQQHKSVRYLVPEKVVKYIQQNGLYQ
jgi:nicotinate-nucleotide adenylyltransferase